ncbi:MAG: hypothetical protein OET44_11285 [Gammaproteobacteria bacterium]|nr:hypothetical protein [Gammaproteobacteria bacterium]
MGRTNLATTRAAWAVFARAVAVPLLLAVALIACTPQTEPPPPPKPMNYYRFPWLEECKSLLEARFAKERKANANFGYQLVYFDQSLKSVPNLRGFIELSSREYQTETLASVAQDVIDECYPTTTRKILLEDRKFRSKLRQTRLLARGIGARHIYARISDKHLHLYFPGKQKPPPQ